MSEYPMLDGIRKEALGPLGLVGLGLLGGGAVGGILGSKLSAPRHYRTGFNEATRQLAPLVASIHAPRGAMGLPRSMRPVSSSPYRSRMGVQYGQ